MKLLPHITALHISNTKTIGLYANGKFKINIKYVITALPSSTNPSCDVLAIGINKEYLKETPGGIITVDLVKAIREGD